MKSKQNIKVALVTESLWKMAGANKVLESFCEIFPNADIYALFGDSKNLSKTVNKHNIQYSFLNRFPLIKKLYRYTYPLWPIAIEQIDFNDYDLVISSSSSVVHGIVTPLNTKHICYLHTPMRYAWDLKDTYFSKKNFSFWKRLVIPIFLNYLRTWDVIASQRSDFLISNSKFIAQRTKKYWDREVDYVINPPVDLYKKQNKGEKNVKKQREDYFVSGAPFEQNKGGDFLLDCAKELGFNLKIIGNGSMLKKFKKRYKDCKNIEFLGWINDDEKWEILSNAKGYVMTGVEDFGIFPIEAISCGTPVLAYKNGGVLETVRDNFNGLFFDYQSVDSFKSVFERFNKKKWDYVSISKSVIGYDKENFKKRFEDCVKECFNIGSV